MVNCPSYDGCDAPLCPLDAQSLAHGTWFPDEEICGAHGQRTRWITMQRSIARKTTDRRRGFFTVGMLSSMWKALPGVRGIDPNSPHAEEDERTWIAGRRHPSDSAIAKQATTGAEALKRLAIGGRCDSDAKKVWEAMADARITASNSTSPESEA